MKSKVKLRAIYALAAAMLLIAASYASAFLPGGAPGWAPWTMSVGTAAAIVATMVAGVARAGVPMGSLRWVFALIFVLVTGAFALALLLPEETAVTPRLLGLPLRAAIVLLAIGFVPLLLVPLAYALTFDRVTLGEDDLERIRAEAARLRGESSRE